MHKYVTERAEEAQRELISQLKGYIGEHIVIETKLLAQALDVPLDDPEPEMAPQQTKTEPVVLPKDHQCREAIKWSKGLSGCLCSKCGHFH